MIKSSKLNFKKEIFKEQASLIRPRFPTNLRGILSYYNVQNIFVAQILLHAHFFPLDTSQTIIKLHKCIILKYLKSLTIMTKLQSFYLYSNENNCFLTSPLRVTNLTWQKLLGMISSCFVANPAIGRNCTTFYQS